MSAGAPARPRAGVLLYHARRLILFIAVISFVVTHCVLILLHSMQIDEQIIRRNAPHDRWFLQLECFDPHEPFTSPQSDQAGFLSPDDFSSRLMRLARIAREAAGQSGRGILPAVRGLLPFEDAVREASRADIPLFFYEGGGESLRPLPFAGASSCSIFTGPEGGFSEEETALARASGMRVASLGPRILRCETAPVAALTAAMLLSGGLDPV